MAVQLTIVLPSGKVEPDGGADTGVMEPSTESAAEAVYETGAPPGPVASAVMSAGKVSTGSVVSWTITSKVPKVVLPVASCEVQETVSVPIENVDPDGGVQLTGRGPSTRSVAVGA